MRLGLVFFKFRSEREIFVFVLVSAGGAAALVVREQDCLSLCPLAFVKNRANRPSKQEKALHRGKKHVVLKTHQLLETN